MISRSSKVKFTDKKYLTIFAFLTSIFMFWGIAITMADVLNKHFQHTLHLNKAQSAFVQFSIFGAYAVMSIPAGLFMKKFGYKNGILLGLSLFGAGAFLFVPAANLSSFTFFGFALFIVGCGLSTLETVAHPFVAALGEQESSDQRMNFAQLFNAVGAMIGPAIGSYFLLRNNIIGNTDLSSVKHLYTVIGSVIFLVAIAFSFIKVPHIVIQPADLNKDIDRVSIQAPKELLAQSHFRWAVFAQFANVAAQAGTWAFFINYGHEKMGFTDAQAGNYMVLFMGMMLAGRLVGTLLMRIIAPNKLLAAFALGNMLMCVLVAQNLGFLSFIALLMINFFFSIMFPTIFSLGLKNLDQRTQTAASFLSMAVVGGAIFPFLMGYVADHAGIATAYYLPIICYIVIFAFAFKYYKVKT